MSESEKQIEEYLRKQVKSIGGKAFKFVSPGNVGVPDRLVCLPGGRIVFVELKAPGRKPSAIQEVQIRMLSSLGFNVMVADSKAEVEHVIKKCKDLMWE